MKTVLPLLSQCFPVQIYPIYEKGDIFKAFTNSLGLRNHVQLLLADG